MPSDDDCCFDDDYGPFEEPPTERPRGVRFGEGQPINRGGRPRGSPNLATMVRRVALKRHRVKIDGRNRRKNTLELVLLAIRNKAAHGDVRAFDLLQKQLQLVEPTSSARPGVLIVGEKFTDDEWVAVYGHDFTDDQVEEQFPYLMRMRKAHQAYQAEIEKQVEEYKRSSGLCYKKR